ncbi:MAG TPA: TonB-dependent receptor [Gemmatimonadota bacterium]|nr:TonB-dependent receptor [Gemmatimonadota bacterium]
MNRGSLFAPIVLVILALSTTADRVAAQETPDSLDLIHMPPIVVTATRTPAPPEEIGSSITVVTRQEIERRQYRTVIEALRAVPGVAVAQAGPGGVASVFLRGAGSDQTLVLLDGIELGDPSTPNGAYDLAHLTTANIERIEIVRGPQSTLYGSTAMGGVIHVLTRGGAGPARLRMGAEAGKHGNFQGRAGLSGGSEALGYSAVGIRRRAGGFSAASPVDGDAEPDDHDVSEFSGRLGWRPGGPLALDFTLRASDAATDRDQEGPGGDDPNAVTEAELLALSARGAAHGWDDRWATAFGVSLVHHDRASRDDPDAARPEERSRSRFEGRRWKLDWQNDFALWPSQRLTAGIETERESAETAFTSDGAFGPFESVFPEESARTTGAFIQHQAGFGDALFLVAGGRLDDHSRFGRAMTWRVSPTFRIAATGTRLKAAYGTGFKAPSLFQLFDPGFGNPALEPEESAGWEAGVEQDLARNHLRVALTGFGTKFEDLVGFTFPEGFRNISAAETRGLEVWASAFPAAGVRIGGSYTFTDAEDASGGEEDGRPLLRRPRHQANLDADADVGRRGNVAFGARWVGARDDFDFSGFPALRVTLDGYLLVRLAAGYDVSDTVHVFGRIENLFDEEYEEVLHFGTLGRAATIGLQAEL